MMPLAKAFVDQGHAVLWAAAGPVCARLEREGFRAVEAGLDEPASMDEFARRFPEVSTLAPAERPDFMFPRLFGDVRAGPMLAGVLPVARDWGPSLVVSEAAELAGPIAAAATGVPGVTHAFGALLPAARVAAAATKVAPLWEPRGWPPARSEGSTTTSTSTSARGACRRRRRRMSPPCSPFDRWPRRARPVTTFRPW